MFERYHDSALLVLASARIEAIKTGSRVIEPEHLLLALLKEDETPLGAILRKHRVDGEEMSEAILKRVLVRAKIPTSIDIPLSDSSKRVLAAAEEESQSLAHAHIGAEHLLLGLLSVGDTLAWSVLNERGLELVTVRAGIPIVQELPARSPHASGDLGRLGVDLVRCVSESGFDPFVGREHELESLLLVLSRRSAPRAILVGPPGAGKTRLLEALAARIAAGGVPAALAGATLLRIDLFKLVRQNAGALDALRAEVRPVIVVLDGLGSAPRRHRAVLPDTWDVVRPALLAPDLRVVATTTPEGRNQLLAREPALAARFTPIAVPPATPEEALAVLLVLAPRYAEHHGVRYREEALAAAVELARDGIPERALPGSAVDLMDLAGAAAAAMSNPGGDDAERLRMELGAEMSQQASALARRDLALAIESQERQRALRQQLKTAATPSIESSEVTRAHVERAFEMRAPC